MGFHDDHTVGRLEVWFHEHVGCIIILKIWLSLQSCLEAWVHEHVDLMMKWCFSLKWCLEAWVHQHVGFMIRWWLFFNCCLDGRFLLMIIYITLHYTPPHYNYNYTTTFHYTPLHCWKVHGRPAITISDVWALRQLKSILRVHGSIPFACSDEFRSAAPLGGKKSTTLRYATLH